MFHFRRFELDGVLLGVDLVGLLDPGVLATSSAFLLPLSDPKYTLASSMWMPDVRFISVKAG